MQVKSKMAGAPKRPPDDIVGVVQKLRQILDSEKKAHTTKITELTKQNEQEIQKLKTTLEKDNEELVVKSKKLQAELHNLMAVCNAKEKQKSSKTSAAQNAKKKSQPHKTKSLGHTKIKEEKVKSNNDITEEDDIAHEQKIKEKCERNFEEDICKDLQQRLEATLMQVDQAKAALLISENEKKELLAKNQILESFIKDSTASIDNYKHLVETEVTELRCKLRAAEEKTLSLAQKFIYSDMYSMNRRCRFPMMNNETTECCMGIRPKYTSTPINAIKRNKEFEERLQTTGEMRPNFASISDLADIDDESFFLPQQAKDGCSTLIHKQDKEIVQEKGPKWSCRGVSKEFLFLISASVLFILSFLRNINTSCKYNSTTYTPPTQ